MEKVIRKKRIELPEKILANQSNGTVELKYHRNLPFPVPHASAYVRLSIDQEMNQDYIRQVQDYQQAEKSFLKNRVSDSNSLNLTFFAKLQLDLETIKLNEF